MAHRDDMRDSDAAGKGMCEGGRSSANTCEVMWTTTAA